MAEQVAPALPGEVTRFDRDGATIVITRAVGGLEGYAAQWRAQKSHRWSAMNVPSALALWAEHERKVAEAERALRKALADLWSAVSDKHDFQIANAVQGHRRAEDVLRALGVEP